MTTPDAQLKRFNFYAPIVKATETEDGRQWVVEGPLSNPDEDLQGETMDMSGLKKGLKVFERLGQSVDWEHLYQRTKNPKYLIGKGIQIFDAPHPKTGHMVPWLRAKLFKDKEIAQEAKRHLDCGGQLGYSVEGGAVRKAGSHIPEPIITMVSLTPQPVVSENAGCVRLVKSLQALAAGETDWDLAELPVVPELLCPPVFAEAELQKALAATGDTPRSGPGVNAAETEDVNDRATDPADYCDACDRRKSRCRCDELRKALAFQMADRLDMLVRAL